MRAAVAFALSVGVARAQITLEQVIEKFQEVLDANEAEAKSDAELYATFHCWCEDENKSQSDAIKTAKQTIKELQASLTELEGNNGEDSVDMAEKKRQKRDLEASLETATTLRGNQNTEFTTYQTETNGYIGQLQAALEKLADYDTTNADNQQDHDQFMKAEATAAAKAHLDEDLIAVASKIEFGIDAALKVSQKMESSGEKAATLRKQAAALMQMDISKATSGNIGHVVGVIKNMEDLMRNDLEAATKLEAKRLEDFETFETTTNEQIGILDTAITTLEENIGANDTDHANKSSELATEEEALETATNAVNEQTSMCKIKEEEAGHRKMWRAKEAAALTEAIRILRSAREVQSTVASKKDMSFLQIGSKTSTGNPIQSLVLKIKETQKEVLKEKSNWERQMNQCKQMYEKNLQDKADTELRITKGGETVTAQDTFLQQADTTLAAIAGAIADMKNERQRATEDRFNDHAAYEKEASEILEAEDLFLKAKAVIEKFYEKQSAQVEAVTNLFSTKTVKFIAKAKQNGGLNWKEVEAGTTLQAAKKKCATSLLCGGIYFVGDSTAKAGSWYKVRSEHGVSAMEMADAAGTMFVKAEAGTAAFVQAGSAQNPPPDTPDKVFTGQSGDSSGGALQLLDDLVTMNRDELNAELSNEEEMQAKYNEMMAGLEADLAANKLQQAQLMDAVAQTKQMRVDQIDFNEKQRVLLASIDKTIADNADKCYEGQYDKTAKVYNAENEFQTNMDRLDAEHQSLDEAIQQLESSVLGIKFSWEDTRAAFSSECKARCPKAVPDEQSAKWADCHTCINGGKSIRTHCTVGKGKTDIPEACAAAEALNYKVALAAKKTTVIKRH